MELTDLRYFYNVATTCSFSQGARLSYVSPPAISKSIKKLEEELETQLFVRTTRRVSLTDSGKILLSHCQQLLKHVDNMHRDLDSVDTTIRGELCIATNEVFSTYLLPNTLARVVRANPDLIPRCYEMIPSKIAHELNQGTIDVGFTTNAREMKDVDSELVAECKGVLVCGRDHPLYEKGTITPEDLAVYPSVVPAFFQREYLKSMDQFPDDRLPRRVGATVELIQMGIQMAMDGAFLGYFAEDSIHCHLAQTELRPLKGIELSETFQFHAVFRKGAKPRAAIQVIIEELKSTIDTSRQKSCAIMT